MNGYTSKRKVLFNDHEYDAVCQIFKSVTNRPLFKCTLNGNNAIVAHSIATNPTTAVKKFFEQACIKISFKNGNVFFGLDRLDVLKLVARECTELSTLSADHPLNVSDVCNKRQATWFGVISFGTMVLGEKYVVKLGESSLRLQPGYESLRSIKLAEDKEIMLHCKVDLDHLQNIIFKCFTTDEPVIAIENVSPTVAVKNAFAALGVITKKKWSGYDFFGFMKQEVINGLCPNKIEVEDLAKVQKKETNDVFKVGMQIRARNAGETSGLKHNKSITARNAAIHNLVQYVSFGDVQSKLMFVYFLMHTENVHLHV